MDQFVDLRLKKNGQILCKCRGAVIAEGVQIFQPISVSYSKDKIRTCSIVEGSTLKNQTSVQRTFLWTDPSIEQLMPLIKEADS